MRCYRTVFVVLVWLLLTRLSFPQTTGGGSALRSAVPLLCTETHQAARTRVRGTGVIADSGGSLLTAAHVIQEARSDCTLSVMIPDGEWSRFRQLHAFFVSKCNLFPPLDLAVCSIRPVDNGRDWGYVRPARIGTRSTMPGEAVSVTSFTGWGVAPLVRSGHIAGRQIYQRQDGCYCDFAIDMTAAEGMSGSPIISAQGEVIGILTLAGSGKFHGISFGASLKEASHFLKEQGISTAPDFQGAIALPPAAR